MDRIDTSYEELRTDIQKRLRTSRSKEEYINLCKEILKEIVKRPESEKFLDIYEKNKTMFYDFTPALIKEAQQQISELQTNVRNFSEQEIGKATINVPTASKDEAGRLLRDIDSADDPTGR